MPERTLKYKETSSINISDEGSILTHPGKVGVDGLFERPGAVQGLHLDVGGPRLHGAIHGAPAAAALFHSASPHPSPDTKRKNINQYFMRYGRKDFNKIKQIG